MPGPSNLYGTANPVIMPVGLYPPTDIPCPAGALTTVATTPLLIAPSSGWFYPLIWALANVQLGATPANPIGLNFNINGGSTVDGVYFNQGEYTANAYIQLATFMIGTASNTAWAGAGSLINIFVSPIGQAVTFKQAGSRFLVSLYRAPDQ